MQKERQITYFVNPLDFKNFESKLKLEVPMN